MAFYELRQYKILAGKMDEWVALMDREIIPFQVAQGMAVTASFRSEKDEDIYIWMRRFESEEEKKRLYEAVYESSRWKNEFGPRIPALIDRSAVQVTRLTPTPKSATQ